MKKKRFHIFASEDFFEEVKLLCEKLEIPMSVYFTLAVKEKMERESK